MLRWSVAAKSLQMKLVLSTHNLNMWISAKWPVKISAKFSNTAQSYFQALAAMLQLRAQRLLLQHVLIRRLCSTAIHTGNNNPDIRLKEGKIQMGRWTSLFPSTSINLASDCVYIWTFFPCTGAAGEWPHGNMLLSHLSSAFFTNILVLLITLAAIAFLMRSVVCLCQCSSPMLFYFTSQEISHFSLTLRMCF